MSRQPRNNQGQPAVPPTTTRQNEYFVPRDGIDREVISADICRYLGNDALVRPGHYENPQTGQAVQGYYITAYRNLTTAMIEDLKADSARWDSERRTQTSRNTTGVQYRYSETHQSRQHHGPTEPPFQQQQDPYAHARDPAFDGPRYPGTGAPGYTGAAGTYPQQQTYAATSGGAYGYQQGQQQNPPADPRYNSAAQAASMMNQGYQTGQDGPYISTGANMPSRTFTSNDPYNANRLGSSTGASLPSVYATSAPPQSGYPSSASYQYQNQPPAPGSQAYPGMPQQQQQQQQQPHDPFYGRAGQAPQQQGYPAQGQQYDETPHPRASSAASTANTQAPASGSSSNRRSDRDTDRHSIDRHTRPPRR